MHTSEQGARIRALNDAFRKTLAGGRVFITPGVQELPRAVQGAALTEVKTFAAFTPDNDPHGEHDFGSFEHASRSFFWKIDYYTPDLQGGSEDPADPEQTTRVLTIMLAEEY